MKPKILIVFYSRTGTTRAVAQMLADELGAELEPLAEPTRRAGVIGYVRSALDALLRRDTKLLGELRDPCAYDLVLVGTPVWSRTMSTPVRAYLEQQRGRLPALGFFATHRAAAHHLKVFAHMRRAAAKRATAELAVSEGEFDRGAYLGRLHEFVRTLGAQVARAAAPAPEITSA